MGKNFLECSSGSLQSKKKRKKISTEVADTKCVIPTIIPVTLPINKINTRAVIKKQ